MYESLHLQMRDFDLDHRIACVRRNLNCQFQNLRFPLRIGGERNMITNESRSRQSNLSCLLCYGITCFNVSNPAIVENKKSILSQI